MESRTLIPAHNGFHKPQQKSIVFHDRTSLQPTALHPSLYSIVRNTSGKVTLTEYADHKDYIAHRDNVFSEIAKFHAQFGKQQGCECATCRTDKPQKLRRR